MTKTEIVKVFHECVNLTEEHELILQDMQTRVTRLNDDTNSSEKKYEALTIMMLEETARQKEATINEKLNLISDIVYENHQ